MAGFDEILGHKKEVAHLAQAIRSGKVSHAYLFNGEKGTGKNMLAKAFAQTLQCERVHIPSNDTETMSGDSDLEHPDGNDMHNMARPNGIDIHGTDHPDSMNMHSAEDITPCGECHSCRQAMSGNHPDIIYLQHEKPASIGVKDVREQLVGDAQIRPYNGKYKIYIINDAEKMTVQAQNAILKTIEEPPEYVIVLLLTANDRMLLDTIRSRCVTLNLKPVPDEVVKEYLMKEIQVPDYQADICAAFAQGNIGKAVRLASSEDFNAIKGSAMRLVRSVGTMEISAIIDYVKEVQEYKVSIGDYLDLLALWYRDMVYYKATKDVEGVIFKDELRTIRETVQTCSYEGVDVVMKAIETAKARLNANVNFDLTMELLFLVIKENIHG
ncbi:MAG: DNA polymerase III subunit [Lachnospiraceae bacterium]|nr:DNA polymerase III subunit [Lachnospiraceae bacterium]